MAKVWLACFLLIFILGASFAQLGEYGSRDGGFMDGGGYLGGGRGYPGRGYPGGGGGWFGICRRWGDRPTGRRCSRWRPYCGGYARCRFGYSSRYGQCCVRRRWWRRRGMDGPGY